MHDLVSIRASIAASIRAKCAHLIYQHAREEGMRTDDVPALLDDLMQREVTLEWIDRLVAVHVGQIH